ncbi:MAG: SIMPL domain-containing protein [Candidatus Shapirobacteria bacterium]
MKNIIMVAGLLIAAVFLLPFRLVNWGKVAWQPAETVTVTGEAKTQVANQLATFTAGIDVINNDKNEATKEINTKMEELVKAAKDFGIEEKDITTQNLSYYQQEESYYEGGVQKFRKGQWRVSSSIEMKLRNIEKATELAGILANSGANNVYGPNFQLDDTGEAENGLFDGAMTQAKAKAEIAAKAAGRSLGKVISVSEGIQNGTVVPMYRSMAEGGGGGTPMEPGSGTVYKTVTVVYELR